VNDTLGEVVEDTGTDCMFYIDVFTLVYLWYTFSLYRKYTRCGRMLTANIVVSFLYTVFASLSF
jgi:hypothetical protein